LSLCLSHSNVSGQQLLQLSLSSNAPFVMPSLLQEIAKMKPPKTEKPDLLQVSSNDSNKDVLKEVRDEIVSTIERISQVSLLLFCSYLPTYLMLSKMYVCMYVLLPRSTWQSTLTPQPLHRLVVGMPRRPRVKIAMKRSWSS
jgi:hypothetical protein